MASVLCVLAFLCFAVCVVQNTEIMVESEDLPQSVETGILMNLLYKLSRPDSAITLQQVRDAEKQEKNRRGVEIATQRPCRVFYWKSWAKC
uniref:Somatostatin/Cortistatin C-terminal domain-containing protein n=1 Tax=Oryzias sinensis TaxID=183150 RepID=A0A8C7YA66_9TELE